MQNSFDELKNIFKILVVKYLNKNSVYLHEADAMGVRFVAEKA